MADTDDFDSDSIDFDPPWPCAECGDDTTNTVYGQPICEECATR